MKLVRLRPTAKRDLLDATGWYRERDAELASRFLDEVYKTLELLQRFPHTGGPVFGVNNPHIRQLPVDNFPYQIIFMRERDFTSVLAIAHERRKPGYWMS